MSDRKRLIIGGIIYVAVMLVTMGLIEPWISDRPITPRSFIGNLVSGVIGGIIFVFVMSHQIRKQKRKLMEDQGNSTP